MSANRFIVTITVDLVAQSQGEALSEVEKRLRSKPDPIRRTEDERDLSIVNASVKIWSTK